MGYVFGTQWTDDMVQAKILDCVSALGLKRMPSRAEFHDFYGSDALTNRIRRSGGYYDWADRPGLPMKESGNKVYIVPSSINQTQICMGAVKTAYEKYRDRYDIIRQLSNALSPSMNF